MATLQNLYDNIKTLTTKYFEEKTIEDKTLPQWVELYFDYNNQGELSINDAPNTQNTLKFTFEGTTLSQYSSGSFNGSNMFIDYGDGIIEKTTGKFGHTYEENKTYKIRIYGITALGTFCFQNCTGLTSIILPNNITNLAAIVFGGCSDLVSIIIPDNVTNIGTQCFRDCVSLTSIILPDSVTNIGSSCFRSCTGLTSVTLPNNVTSLGDYCFRYCTNLTEIILQWDSFSEIISYNSSWIDGCTLFDHFLIPEGTTQLYIDAGYPSELLKEEGVVDRVSLTSDKPVLSYVYGESVVLTATAIDEDLPASGETVTFYQGETVLGTETTGDDGKASFTVTGLNVGSYSFTAGFDVYTSNTVNVTVNKLESTITLVTDKSVVDTGETYTLSGVLSVGSGESVKIYNGSTLVDTLTTETDGTFSKTLTASGVGLTQTYHAAFEGTSIYDEATSSNVTVDVLSDNIMNLTVTGSSFSTYSSSPFTYTGKVFVDWGDDTGFIEYTGGTLNHTYSSNDDYTIKIYGDITSLEENCFRDCSGLTSINIFNSVINLGDSCFRGCTGLTSITLPNSLNYIGFYCFYGCSGLNSIEIPASVLRIRGYCFWYCSNLNSIILNWITSNKIVEYLSSWVDYTLYNTKFNIPQGTISLYTAKSYPSNQLEERATPTVDSVSLTGDKSILSYTDSESATLSATVLDQLSSPMSGVTVEFFNGSTSMGTATTNSSGVATITYSATGNGDVVFSATGNNLISQPITIEDCLDYDTLTSDNSKFTLTGGVSATYNNTGLSVLGTSTANSYYMYQGTVPTNYIFECDVVSMTLGRYDASTELITSYCGISNISQTAGAKTRYGTFDTNYNFISYSDETRHNPPFHLKVVINNGTCTYFIDGVQVHQRTCGQANLGFKTYQNRGMVIKDMKLKPLNSISLVASQSILSYADGDSTTLTATHSLGTGKTVNLYNASDDTLIGAMTDNEDGTYSYTYNSQGIGDLTVYANDGNLSSETYTIEDCIFYDPCTSNAKASAWTIPSGVSSTYSSDGWNITANAYKQIKLTDKLTSACSVEFTLVDYNYVSAGASVIIYQYTNGETTPNQIILGNRDANSESKINVLGTTLTRQLVKGGVYRIEYTASTMKVYENNILLGSASNNVGLPTRFEIHQGAGGRYAVYKNLKIKPLPSISLVSSQSILSYADNDSTVLTATHGLGTGKIIKLYDASDNTLIGAMTDNEDGTYSYTYNSQGNGDLTVYASDGDIVSEDILIEDCYYANIGDTDKSSDFDIANAWTSKNVALGTVTVTNNNEWYTITRTGGGSDYAFIPISKLTGINKAFTLSCVIETKQGTPDEGTYCGMYGENYNATWSTAYPCRIVHTTTGSSDNWNKVYDYSVSYGVYKMELTFDGTSYNYKLYDSNGTLQRDLSVTMNSRQNNTSNTVRYGVVISNVLTSGFVVLRIKDIKAKVYQDELPGAELAP